MVFKETVLKTKFLPLGLTTDNFSHQRILKLIRLIKAYRLLIINSGPGYGKSTILAEYLQTEQQNVFWYNLSLADKDPATFLNHLLFLLEQKFNGEFGTIKKLLWGVRQKPQLYQRIIDDICNALLTTLTDDYTLIFDDFHLIAKETIIQEIFARLIYHAPPKLHFILATRNQPQFDFLTDWLAKGQALTIGQNELALTPTELNQYFKPRPEEKLSLEDLSAIYQQTRGWILALKMIYQNYQKGHDLKKILEQPRQSLPHLFDFLASELLAAQDEQTQLFLLKTSILNDLNPKVVSYLSEQQHSQQILTALIKDGLILTASDNKKYTYHPLFKSFLQRSLQKDACLYQKMNQKAAHYFQDLGDTQQAIEHFINGENYEVAVRLIIDNKERLLNKVSRAVIESWILKTPVELKTQLPRLLLIEGDLKRYKSSYEEAEQKYLRALSLFEKKQDNGAMLLTLQKLTILYLDTVQPLKAEKYLQRALALQEKEELSEETSLLNLLAENLANQGYLDQADQLIKASQNLDFEATSPWQEIHLQSRFLLRMGRLEQAEKLLLKTIVDNKNKQNVVPLTHRETPLVLSLIYAFQGKICESIKWGKQGLLLGQKMNSPFTEAVGHMRLAHSYQLSQKKDSLIESCYQEGLKLMEQIKVERGRAEALWGLTLFYGLKNNLNKALNCGQEALAIVVESGDEWMAHQIKIALAISYYANKEKQQSWQLFSETLYFFQSINDLFGQTISLLWLAVILYQEQEQTFINYFTDFLKLVEAHNFHFLYQKPTLLGLRDYRLIFPLFIDYLRTKTAKNVSNYNWYNNLEIKRFDYHPGFTLHINCLGGLKVERNNQEITDGEWKREKAKELFKLFIAFRGQLLLKEQIFEFLYPEQRPQIADRDFKVALNALNKALEPNRPARVSPYFIKRVEQGYGLNLKAPLIIDADIFKGRINKALNSDLTALEKENLLTEALELYQGDFLVFSLYYEWLLTEREQLKNLFFRGGEALAKIYLQQGKAEQALAVAEKMLNLDHLWEIAYQLGMEAYLMMDQRYMAQKLLIKCYQNLDQQLGVEPLAQTQAYLKRVFLPEEIKRITKQLS